MDNTELSFDIKHAKRPFSRVGLALVLFFVSTIASQIILLIAIGLLFPSLAGREFTYTEMLVISSATMYLVGFPVFCLVLRPIEKTVPEKKKFSLGELCIVFLIATFFMHIGQILGEVVYTSLYDMFGFSLGTQTLDIVSNITWYEALIFAVLIGPLVEELIFRKLIIDRTRVYGEKLAMVFSALMFAFFHMSILQFFYAFFIGLLLSYFYLRSGNIVSCWIVHALINFFGSTLPLFLLDFVDIEAFLAATEIEELYKLVEENLLGYGMFALYGLGYFALIVAGLVFFILKIKAIHFESTALKLPKDSEASVAFMNAGVISFILFAVVYPIFDAYIQVQV